MDINEILTIGICGTMFVAACILSTGIIMYGLQGSDVPTYVEYYQYPYGPNGTLVNLPIHYCYNDYWWAFDLHSMERAEPFRWYNNGTGGICSKEYH